MGQEVLYLISIIVSVPMLILFPAFMFTPMWCCLMGRFKGLPVYYDVENHIFRIPQKVEGGMEIFTIRGEKVMNPHDNRATEKTSFGEFGLLYPSNCVTVNPKAIKIAGKLKAKGYKRITEAQIALALIALENDYPDIDPMDSTKFYKVTDSFGKVQNVSGMEFIMGEMEERGIYPFAITAKEIKKLIGGDKFREAEELERPLREMIDYVGLETRPASLSNWVNESVNMAKNENLLGSLKKNAFNIAVVVGILMALGIAVFLLQKGGGLNAVMGAKTTVTTLVKM